MERHGIRLYFLIALMGVGYGNIEVVSNEKLHVIELTDNNWEMLREGAWMIGIFHPDSPKSIELAKEWNAFALKCKELDIKVGSVNTMKSPALQARFLVKSLPSVFYINEGDVRFFKTVSREEIGKVVKNNKWKDLELVNGFIHPFSHHVSIFAYAVSQSLRLYNFEKRILFKYVQSAYFVNIAFWITLIGGGTIVGLMTSCLVHFGRYFVESFLKDAATFVTESPPVHRIQTQEKPPPTKHLKNSKRRDHGDGKARRRK